MCLYAGACKVQTEVSGYLEVELEMVVKYSVPVLGTKLRYSAKVGHVLIAEPSL